MTVRVAGIYLVDGDEIQILVEGGSAKEAYEALLHEVEEIGGVPAGGEPPAAGAAPKKRNRRTKAEMEAARVAATTENAAPPRQPTPELPGPAAPAQPAPISAFAPQPFAAPAQQVPVGPELVALPPGMSRPGDWAPPAGPPAAFTDDPRVPQDGKTVGFDGPPPPAFNAPPAPPPALPPRSEEDDLRAQIDVVLERTITLQPAWADHVRQQWARACNGEQMGVMRADRLRQVLTAVSDYEGRVKEALAQRR